MKVTFEITNAKQHALARRFCQFVIKHLRDDILAETNFRSIQTRADLLLSASWIQWNKLPQNIDAKRLCVDILKCLEYKQRKSTFTIEFSRKRLMNNSRTPLESVARYIDKGNDIVKGTYFITKVTTKYQKKIYSYWRAYCLHSQMQVVKE